MSVQSLEARIKGLQSEDLNTETLRDILRDMMELEPADYANLATNLCFKLLDYTEPHQTMREFMEAQE